MASLLTTTASDVDPGLLKRCFVLCVNKQSWQTAAIQQEALTYTINDLIAAEDTEPIRRLHHNTQ